MESKSNTAIFMRYALSFILAGALIFSFGLHSVQIDHIHFNALHSHTEEHKSKFVSLETYMHLSDKKIFLFIPIATLLPFFILNASLMLKAQLVLLSGWYTRLLRRQSVQQSRVHNYLCYFLRKGIFHSKAY